MGDDVVKFQCFDDLPALGAKAGDTIDVSRQQAERWASVSYGVIVGDPEPVAESPNAPSDEDEEGEDEDVLFGCKERFTWLTDAPLLGKKVGDQQLIPRELSRKQAERWEALGHGRIDRIEKPQKLVDFTWRHYQQQAFNVAAIQPGQTTQVPEREARRMELQGLGSIGKTLKPYVRDEAAIRRFYAEEAARNPRQLRSVPVDFDRRSGRMRYAPDGWLADAGRWG